MATANLNDFLQRLGRSMTAEVLDDQSDRQLVQRALAQPDGVALQAIVQRHGAMVYRVCWCVLRHAQDTEDAFQAAFLVLAQKLRTVRKHASLASWLHGVAYRVALKAKLQAAARRRRETAAAMSDMLPSDDLSWQELHSVLDSELSRLPDQWRLPLVICYLEGRTQDEAAGQLGWSKSTLRRRLDKARNALAQRLTRRGIVLSAALSAVLLSDCAASAAPGLVAATVDAALKVAAGERVVATSTPAVAVLTQGVLKAMFMTQFNTVAVVMVAALCATVSIGVFTLSKLHAQPADPGNPIPLVGNDQPPTQSDLQSNLALRTLAPLPIAQNSNARDLITKDAQKAIDAALAYLAQVQAADGSWGAEQMRGSVAVTSLTGLAFLSGNHHPDRGAYGKLVTKALRYVLRQEQKDTPGFFHSAKTAHGPMYGQGFAVLFLADAHGTITDMQLKSEVKKALTRAVKLLIDSQNNQGGWRYQPKPQDADVSVTSCQVAALRAARDAGISVPKATIDKAIDYVKSCQHPTDGGFRYLPGGGPSGFARTAAALTSLNRLGVMGGQAVDDGMNYLRRIDLKSDAAQAHYFYGHYYAAKAMWYAGEDAFQKWYPTIRDELLANLKEGNRWSQGMIAEPQYCTAVALIVLQMPHGHLASLKR